MVYKNSADIEKIPEEKLNISLIELCLKGDLDAVKKNLASRNLKDGEIHVIDDFAFHLLMNKRHIHILEYLIFDCKAEQTPSLKKFINSYSQEMSEKVSSMFKLREVEELSQELKVNTDSKIKKKKI